MSPTIYLDGNVSRAEGNTGTTPFTFIARLSAASDAPVSVSYATADGTATVAGGDYQAASGTLTFAPGETSKTLTVLVNGDRVGEPDETFSVHLSNPSSAPFSSTPALGTILNDEPTISINSASGVEGNTGTTALPFTVTLSAASDAPVSVSYATTDGTATVAGGDYQATSGTLTFAPGETSKTLTVLVNGDRVLEPNTGFFYNEEFYVNLSQAVGAIIGNYQGVGTILEDEPRIGINDVQIIEGNSATVPFAFRVGLSVAYDVPVTVNFATYNGSAQRRQRLPDCIRHADDCRRSDDRNDHRTGER